MSVAFRRFDRANSAVVGEVSEVTSAIMVEEGKDPADVFTTGNHAADIAGKLLLTALDQCGALTTPIDIDAFRAAVRDIEDDVLPAGRIRQKALEMAEAGYKVDARGSRV